MVLTTLLRDLRDIIWPRTCEVCGRTLLDGEQLLCLHCLAAMPRTHLHLSPFNSIHQRLARNTPIERAGAMMTYRRGGEYSALIRRGKYNDRPEIIRTLAMMYASELKADGFFEGIDIILPVPMHRWKKIRRGYNQSEVIADGISKVTGIPVGDNLRATRGHKTQTRRSSFERYQNVSSIFEVRYPEELTGLHILLVDDVITSGATLHSCAKTLADTVGGIRISIATLATAAN